MKARVVEGEAKTKTISYDYDKNVVLSVGMIVKNEGAMLSTCLDCLKPLLDNVASELVIVDTGSTDNTVEIARRYTDKVYHFDWVDDFSAARNFGLEKCVGQWFMFLDADDHFVDVTEMVEFFNNQNVSKNYNTAYYVTHNFTSTAHDKYFRFFAHRLARKTDELHFEGAIHEYFVGYYSPEYYFSSYANHYGYAFESEKQAKAKSRRNLVLLEKELAKDPDDLRTIYHCVASMIETTDQKRELIERAMILADDSVAPVLYTAYFNAYEMYDSQNQPEKAIAALERAINKAKPNNAVLADAYACKALQLYKLGEYQKAEENIYKYLEIYDKKDSKELDNSALGFVVSNFLIPEGYAEMKNKLATCVAKQNKDCTLDLVYSEYDLCLSADVYKSMADTVVSLYKDDETKAYIANNLGGFYKKVLRVGDADKLTYFERKLEELYYLELKSNRQTLFEALKGVKSGFAELMQICQGQSVSELEQFLKCCAPLPESYSEAVYLALKHKVDLSSALSSMNNELILTHLLTVSENHKDLPSLALSYKDESFYFSSIKKLLFGVLLFQAALKNARAEDNQRLLVCRGYAKYLSFYVANIYNADLLNENDLDVLPEAHRFGYYMASAQGCLDNDDKGGYVRALKSALNSCRQMGDVVRCLLGGVEKNC